MIPDCGTSFTSVPLRTKTTGTLADTGMPAGACLIALVLWCVAPSAHSVDRSAQDTPDRTPPRIMSIRVPPRVNGKDNVSVLARVTDENPTEEGSVWIEYRTPDGRYVDPTPMFPRTNGIWRYGQELCMGVRRLPRLA